MHADPTTQGADDEALIRWLRDHEDHCPACRYSLMGLAAPECPECGASLALGVRAPNLHLGPWMLGVISFTLGLGFDAVVCVLMAIALTVAFFQGSMGAGPPLTFYVLPASLLVLGLSCLAGVALLILRRPRWLRLPPHTQWKAAIAIFIGVGAVHLAAGLVFFILN